MPRLILLRHGESVWNAQERFTGWVDVDLSADGRAEADRAGGALLQAGLLPDVVHTSLLRRAIDTAYRALDAADRHWIPVRRSWRLNERHYGALQGRVKGEIREKYGEEQFMLWRRSHDHPPPPLDDHDPYSQADDPRYAALGGDRPRTECPADVMARLSPYWASTMAPDLEAGRIVLVVAHGTSLRAIVKHLDELSEAQAARIEIPTGIPFVYELDEQMRPVVSGGRYLDGAAVRPASAPR